MYRYRKTLVVFSIILLHIWRRVFVALIMCVFNACVFHTGIVSGSLFVNSSNDNNVSFLSGFRLTFFKQNIHLFIFLHPTYFYFLFTSAV